MNFFIVQDILKYYHFLHIQQSEISSVRSDICKLNTIYETNKQVSTSKKCVLLPQHLFAFVNIHKEISNWLNNLSPMITHSLQHSQHIIMLINLTFHTAHLEKDILSVGKNCVPLTQVWLGHGLVKEGVIL